MKRFLFVTAALLAMSASFCFGQSKEDIKASIDRCAKLEKLCSKQPKQTGVADVDTYVQGVYNAAISSAVSSALLQDLYYRQIGETKDGVTDVSIKKPTVEELVAFGRFPHSGGRLNSKDKEMIDKAIDYMELETFRERFIDELSGGQRQRAYIAMVIAQDTEYVLLDEPTNNLDIYHASNLMKIVRRLCDELGKTVILVLHEINYAAFYSDYICAFKDGKIASFGTVEEVITKENLSSIYNVEFEIMQIKGKPLSIYY